MVSPSSGNDREDEDIIQAASRVLRGDFEEEGMFIVACALPSLKISSRRK